MTHSFIWYLLRDSCKAELTRDVEVTGSYIPHIIWGPLFLHKRSSQTLHCSSGFSESWKQKLFPKTWVPNTWHHFRPMLLVQLSHGPAWLPYRRGLHTDVNIGRHSSLRAIYGCQQTLHSFKKAFPVLVTHGKWGPPIAAIASVGHFLKPNELWCQSQQSVCF